MLFILKTDFYIQIPEEQLDKIIGSDDIWEAEVPRSIEFVKSYLRSRYDVSTIFAPFLLYLDATAYAVGDRLYWTEATYDITKTYSTDDRVVYSGNIYKSKAGNAPGVWNAAEWDFLAADKTLYYCIVASTGNLPTDTTYWTAGDTRNQDLLTKLIDIILYNIYSRLNSPDITDIRKERYDGNDSRQTGGAIGWLKLIVKGQIQPDLPLEEDNQEDQTGNRVIFGYAETATDKNTTF